MSTYDIIPSVLEKNVLLEQQRNEGMYQRPHDNEVPFLSLEITQIYQQANDFINVDDVFTLEEQVHQVFMQLMQLGITDETLLEKINTDGDGEGQDYNFGLGGNHDDKRDNILDEDENIESVLGSAVSSEGPQAEGEEGRDDLAWGESDEENEIDENEYGHDELEEENKEENDEEFRRWIGEDSLTSLEGMGSRDKQQMMSQMELKRLHMGDEDDEIIKCKLPERFAVEAIKYKRRNLGQVESSVLYEVVDEGIWILLQLRQSGYFFARSDIAAEVVENKTVEELRDSPLIRCINRALYLMMHEHLEPAHIAIYYKDELYPLLEAFFDCKDRIMLDCMEAAFSSVTGEHHLPCNVDYPGEFELRSRRVSQQFALLTSTSLKQTQRLIRKPGSVILGRILWEIFDLSMTAHKHERDRAIIVNDMLKVPIFTPYLSVLKRSTFYTLIDSIFWDEFSKFLHKLLFPEGEISSLSSKDYLPLDDYARALRAERNWISHPMQAINDLQLTDRFFDLFMNPANYHSNLALYSDVSAEDIVAAYDKGSLYVLKEGTMRTRGTPEEGETLVSWFEKTAAATGINKDARAIQRLFVDAMVEYYSQLPLVRKVVYDTYLLEGEVIVLNNQPGTIAGIASGVTKVFRINDLLELNPLRFQELLNLAPVNDAGPLRMKISVNIDSVLDSLRVKDLYLHPKARMDDVFNKQRYLAFVEMARYICEHLVPHVRSALLRVSNQAAAKLATAELGKLCSLGPYQPTHLALSTVDSMVSHWDTQWNALEALPAPNTFVVPGRARICAVFAADRSETATFVFCDETGTLSANTRWKRANLKTSEGRSLHHEQCKELLSLILQQRPHVIAVAMLSISSTKLYRTIENVIHDYVHPSLGTSIPVVYAFAFATSVFSMGKKGVEEFGAGTDGPTKAAVAIARFLRDPLLELCRYFDGDQRDILQFPLKVMQGSDTERLYSYLEREMSLWVTMVGFDLSEILQQSHAKQILQFCAGLGPRKALDLIRTVLGADSTRRIGSRAYLINNYYLKSKEMPAIALNFGSSIRVFLSSPDDLGAESMHFADSTLIPCYWYPIADRVVQWMMLIDNQISREQIHDEANVATAWTYVAEMVESDRWACVCDLRYTARFKEMLSDIFTYVRALASERAQAKITEQGAYSGIFYCYKGMFYNENQLIPTQANIDFIFDEIIALGASFARQMYRKPTGNSLLKQLTGITYYPSYQTNIANRTTEMGIEPPGMITKEGDLSECTVVGYNSRRLAIRLTNAYGLDVQLGTTSWDISDDALRIEAVRFLEALDDFQRRAGRETTWKYVPPKPPQWCEIGAQVYGTVVSCNYGLCEIKIRWAPTPTNYDYERIGSSESKDVVAGETTATAAAAGDLLWQDFTEAATSATATSMISSVKSAMIEEGALTYATKAASHPLLRNDPDGRLTEQHLLKHDIDIGEVCLRPMPGKHRWLVVCIKTGMDSVSNWPMQEVRNTDGSLSYMIPNIRLEEKYTFENIEHMISNFVRVLAENVKLLREHRHFCRIVKEADYKIDATVQAQMKSVNINVTFSYSFTEVPPTGPGGRQDTTSSGANSSVNYAVIFKVGGKRHQVPILIVHRGYYVKLKEISGGKAVVSKPWVKLSNPEEISARIKRYANEMQKKVQKGQRIKGTESVDRGSEERK